MLKHRVIPCLLLQNGGLVKTRRFRKPVYIGDPINAIRIFNDKEADELLVLDISASGAGREPQYELIEQFAGECFMPLSYGGGVQSVDQASRLFAIGVEKVSVQSAGFRDPGLITRLAERFGNQAIVASIDVKRDWLRRPRLYSAASGRIVPGSWLEHTQALVAAGAGEVLLGSVDRDGTMQGMDLQLIRECSDNLDVPLVAVGGAGSLDDIGAALNAGASAVAAGALFVFHGPHRAVLITYPTYDELQQLLETTE